MAESRYFEGKISITNNLTQKNMELTDVLFTLSGSTITVYFPEDLTVVTSDKDSDGTLKSYKIFKKFDREIIWDFGDGTIVRGMTATHYYSRPGRYRITCTCFDEDGNPYTNNSLSLRSIVTVVDLLSSTLTFSDRYKGKIQAGLLNEVYAGSSVEAGELIATLDKVVTKNVPILCNAANTTSTSLQKLENVSAFRHLIPYNTFLDSSNNPITSITPTYNDVYAAFSLQNNKLHINLYVIVPNYNPGVDADAIRLDSNIPYSNTTYTVASTNDINELSYYIGRIGKIAVYYHDDSPCTEAQLTYALDQSYFPETNEIVSAETINLVSAGVGISIKTNTLTGFETIFYSANGLAGQADISATDLASNAYSINRAMYIGVESPFILRVIPNPNTPYFAKDLKIIAAAVQGGSDISEYANIKFYTNYQTTTGIKYTDIGSCVCSITPLKETIEGSITFMLDVELEDYEGNFFVAEARIENLTFINLESFTDSSSQFYLDPKQNYKEYSVPQWLKVYETHPVFENTPIFDQYMLSVFGQNGCLERIINKGWNAVDDVANVKTCDIKHLISILESLNLPTELYNNENFSHPTVINDLMNIFSIGHGKLIGTTHAPSDEFETFNLLPGVNRGEKLELSTKIYIPKDIHSNFVWPKIIAYDKFAKQYFILNTALLEHIEGLLQVDDYNNTYFTLSQYTPKIGWNLILPSYEQEPNEADEEFKARVQSRRLIDLNHFYNFYTYKTTDTTTISDSYLKPETISSNVLDYDTWNKDDGSIDRLLFKTLIEKLGLNTDNE